MKKVLFLTYDFPFPTTSGGKNRAYHMLKYGTRGVEVHLFSFVRDDFKKEYESQIKKLGVKEIITVTRKRATKGALLKEVLQKPAQSIFRSLYFSEDTDAQISEYMATNGISILHAESFYAGFYITKKRKLAGIKQIYGSENVEFNVYKEFVKTKVPMPLKPFYKYQVARIEKEERQMCKIADLCITVSEEDKGALKKLTNAPVEVIANGIDLDKIKFMNKNGTVRNLLFVGNFSYFPNTRAIEEFYKNVFIKLHDARLIVVGKQAREKLSFVTERNVDILDFVEDLEDVYRETDVFIFPVRFGGGTNFKVLEAMAFGIPIVGFGDKIQNINGITDSDYFPVKDYEEMTKVIQKLVNGQIEVKNVVLGARTVIEKNYSWDTIGSQLSRLWQNL